MSRSIHAVAFLIAIAVACGGSTIREPDADNELPFGFVDTPAHNQTVGRVVEVAGWALDDSAIAGVRLYVDGRYNASAKVGGSRPDVLKAYPMYAGRHPDQAWHAVVDLGERAGPHTIIVQAVDDEGATRDIASLVVDLIGR